MPLFQTIQVGPRPPVKGLGQSVTSLALEKNWRRPSPPIYWKGDTFETDPGDRRWVVWRTSSGSVRAASRELEEGAGKAANESRCCHTAY